MEVIISQIVAYGIIAFLQAVLVVVCGIYIVDVSITLSVVPTMLIQIFEGHMFCKFHKS